VSLSFADDALSVSVLDRGDGFDVSCLRVANDGSRFGLFSIGERVHYLGGRMDLRSHPGAGTTVTLRMPLSGSSVSEGGGESQ
jgi:signal transduction histidine kinase